MTALLQSGASARGTSHEITLRDSALAKDNIFIFPHDESGESYDTKALFAVKQCDLVIAEVSEPATGQGLELGWADVFGIPIVCLYQKDVHISSSLRLVSKALLQYKDTKDMIQKMQEAVSEYAKK